MIRLKFPQHMHARMVERGIDVDHIRKAINNPDLKEDAFQGRIRVTKELTDGRTMEVIYYREAFKGSKDYVIITAYYLSNE